MLVSVLLLGAVPATATPASDKREQARAVKQQVDALDREVEVATEAYNEARVVHENLTVEIEATQALIVRQNEVIESLQDSLEARAASMYRNGPATFLEVLFGARDFEQFAATWDFLRTLNEDEAESITALAAARAEARAAEERLAVQQAEAKTALDTMATKKADIEGRLAERKRMLAGLESEIARIEAAERARTEAAAQAAVSRNASVAAQNFPPPTRAARGEVVPIAKRYLGAPYRWGASGPDSFDCSGFTVFVYRQVGVSLPHSSRAQYGVGEKVSRANLQPGDLVFFGSPISHVGIYVGGGQYIHAPRTGDVVRIASLGSRSNYVGATRP